MAKKYLDDNGLLYLWGKIKATFMTDIDYNSTTNYITKTKNGSTSNVVQLPSGVSPSSTTPKMDGTAATGSETAFARGDHVHPTDTSRAASSHTHGNITNGGALQTTDITIANGDKLVVTDSSNSSKVARASASFDGSTTSKALTQKGTFESFVQASSVGTASGICPLDSSGKVDSSYLPSYVDDVIEAYPRSQASELSSEWLSLTSGGGKLTPETGKIYVLMAASTSYDVNTQFRWGGTAYVKLADGGVTAITNAEIDTIVAS